MFRFHCYYRVNTNSVAIFACGIQSTIQFKYEYDWLVWEMLFQEFIKACRPLVLFQVAAPTEPDFVEKYQSLDKKRKLIIDTIRHHHHEAYLSAAGEHLKDKTGRYIDLEKLDDEDTRKKFVDSMATFYRDKAKGILKAGVKPEDEFENEIMMQAVYGVSKEALRHALTEGKKDYTLEVHQKQVKEIVDAIDKNLRGISTGHISEKHIDDIIKYTKADEAAKKLGYEFNKGLFTREHAAGLLKDYLALGNITKQAVDQYYPAFKKKKK